MHSLLTLAWALSQGACNSQTAILPVAFAKPKLDEFLWAWWQNVSPREENLQKDLPDWAKRPSDTVGEGLWLLWHCSCSLLPYNDLGSKY